MSHPKIYIKTFDKMNKHFSFCLPCGDTIVTYYGFIMRGSSRIGAKKNGTYKMEKTLRYLCTCLTIGCHRNIFYNESVNIHIKNKWKDDHR